MEKNLSKTTGTLMIIVALIIDLLQFVLNFLHLIPLVGNAIAFLASSFLTILAWVTFYIWFKIKGIDFVSSKRKLAFGGVSIVESIPVLSSLPAWTLLVIIIIVTTKAEKVIANTTGISVNQITAPLKGSAPNIPREANPRIEQNSERAKIKV